MQFLDNLKPLGLLILRLAVGISFMFYGYPKLSEPAHALKSFAGYGFPSYFAYISGILELFGGGLLVIGLFTRGAALLLAIEMGIVLARVKLPAFGIYNLEQYDLPLLLGTAALALVTTGAGVISLDALTFESHRKTPKKSKSKN